MYRSGYQHVSKMIPYRSRSAEFRQLSLCRQRYARRAHSISQSITYVKLLLGIAPAAFHEGMCNAWATCEAAQIFTEPYTRIKAVHK